MKVLVTGATGFVGSDIARTLVRLGNDVTIFHRTSSKLDILEGDDRKMSHAIGDLGDRESCLAACKGHDAVFHVAGDVDQGDTDAERQYKINVVGTRNMCEGAAQTGVKRFVHTSSVSAIGYPEFGGLCDENSPFNFGPLKLTYMETKNQAEQVVQEFIRRGLDAVLVNPATVYGPGDRKSLMAEGIRNMAKGRLPAVPAGGMNLVFVEDVTQCHLLAWKKGKTGERYIAGGENMTYYDFACRIAALNNRRAPFTTIPGGVAVAGARLLRAVGEVTKWHPPLSVPSAKLSSVKLYYSSQKSVRDLGYRITSFTDGMTQTLKWMRQVGYLR